MRTVLFASACVLALSGMAFAGIPVDQGKLVQGRYFASGKATFAGITINYLRARASVTAHGRIKANLVKVVTSNTGQSFSTMVRLRGNVRSLKFKRGAFTAPARMHLSDGAIVTGSFHGLNDTSARLSRYFQGDISGATHTNFVFRAR
jgi:hypothetical protein